MVVLQKLKVITTINMSFQYAETYALQVKLSYQQHNPYFQMQHIFKNNLRFHL